MRLGSFWGLTAPMLLFLQDANNTSCISSECFNYATRLLAQSGALKDSLLEASYFSRYLSHLDLNVSCGHDLYFKVNKTRKFNKSGIVINGLVSEEETRLFILDCAYYVVMKALSDYREGLSYDFGFTPDMTDVQKKTHLIQAIQSTVSGQIFPLTRTGSILNKYLKSCETNENSDPTPLIGAFGLQYCVPSEYKFQGKVVKNLSDDTQKLVTYFLHHFSSLSSLVAQGIEKDVEPFGVPFTDLIRRKPSALYYIVSDCFDYVKGQVHKVLLLNTIENVKTNMDLFEQAYKTRVYNSNTTFEEYTVDKSYAFINSFEPKKHNFFSRLLQEELIRINQCNDEVLQFLSELFDSIYSLTPERISFLAGLPENPDWDLINKELASIGLYGLNFRGLDLFAQAIENTVLVFDNSISKNTEEIEEIDSVVSDVYSLLDSLIPIGGAI